MCRIVVWGKEIEASKLGKHADGKTRPAQEGEVLGRDPMGDMYAIRADQLPARFAKRAMVAVEWRV